MTPMNGLTMRIRILGILLVVAGLAVAGAGFAYGLPKADDGLASAERMYEAQGIELSYDENGTLIDRGTPEGAQKIMDLLTKDWKFPVDQANFDPADPLVNTRDELMFQYATITYHILNREVDVKLAETDVPITYRGVTYTEAGTYKIKVEKYYADLDRNNPIERQLRATGWDPLGLSLLSMLAGAHANQGVGELAEGVSLAIGALGSLLAVAGAGLVWVSFGREAPVAAGRAAARGAPQVSILSK